MRTVFAVSLALCASFPLALATGFAIGDREPAASKPTRTKWIYTDREQYTTAQKGVVVICQSKTNSSAFGSGEFAKLGDVVIRTCRAVKTPVGLRPGQVSPSS